MKRLLTMAYLIQKRLLKKPGFIIILLLIPVIAVSVTAIAKKDTGILRIAVYPGKGTDSASKAVLTRIKEHEDIINFRYFKNPSSAKDTVKHGKADVAWIFPDNLKSTVTEYIENPTSDVKLVNIFIMEENIPTKLSGELLFGAVFPEISKEIYLDYMNNDLDLKEKISEKELLDVYNKIDTDTAVIKFVDAEGKVTEKTKFLVSPIRGILSIFIMISALASAMYFYSDSEMGAFTIMPRRRRLFLLFCSVFFGAFDCAVVSFVSLLFTPLFTSFFAETVSLLLFVLTVSAFAAFFSVLLSKPERIGVFLVFISLFVFAFCPVFFSLDLPQIQRLLPQTYYLNMSGISNLTFEILLLFGYFSLTIPLFYITEKIKK